MSFNSFERKLGNIISGFPFIKAVCKTIYLYINFLFQKKKYKIKLYTENNTLLSISEYTDLNDLAKRETMFGYFDISPWSEDSRYYLFNLINKNKTYDVVLYDNNCSKKITVCNSKAFNTQHCNLLQWIGKDIFIFNDIHNNRIISKIYNVDGNYLRKSIFPVHSVSHDYKNLFQSITLILIV